MTKNKSAPTAPEGKNGNTDILPPNNSCFKWDFVLNNYNEEEENQLLHDLHDNCKYFIYGKEVGEQGTPHLQGYFNLIKKQRLSGLKTIFGKRFSFRPCRNEKALIAYCKKDGDFFEYTRPETGAHIPMAPPVVKIIQDLYPWQKEIEDIFLEEPDERKIYWFWESTGNIGKSAFVKYMVVKHKVLFTNGGKNSDLINLVFNSPIETSRCIIWDLPRATKGKISCATLESVKNGMVCNTKYETGVKVFNSPHIFVFSNYPPQDTEDLSEDRWIIKEL